MKILVLGGCGAMGKATTWELAQNDAVETVVIGDIDTTSMEALAEDIERTDPPTIIETREVNVTRSDELLNAISGADVVANALPYVHNLRVMDKCLAGDAHYLDLGGLYHTTREQLNLNKEFEDAELSAILGIGASPGMTNVAAAKGANQIDIVEEIQIRTGAKGGGEGFAYSARTILNELTTDPMVFENGEYHTLEPMSGRERYRLPEPVGTVEGFYSIHSELATLPEVYTGIDTVEFRVAFSPELVTICDVLINLNFTSDEPVEFKGINTSPREFLHWHLSNQSRSGDVKEWKSFRVDVKGTVDGEAVHYRYSTVVGSHLDDWGLSATAYWTGIPLGVAAVIVGQGEALCHGANPPEIALDPDMLIDQLRDRCINVEEECIIGL